jgi:peptidoglycan/LPS O-acetylase OafA/YrhL
LAISVPTTLVQLPEASPKTAHGRIETVHTLRGLAAGAVAFHHFFTNNPSFYSPALLKEIADKGSVGVDVFFVISGFILPYSLWRAGYRISPTNFFRFVAKRVIRLDPPYFVTIALVLMLDFISSKSPGFHGPPFHLYPVQVLLHLGYLNAFTGWPFISPIFWTLAVEFQFYLLIALSFPLFVSPRWTIRIAGMALLLAATMLIPGRLAMVQSYLPEFICGIMAFQWFTGISRRWELLLVLLPALAVLDVRFGAIRACVTLLAALVIVLAPSLTNRWLAVLGTLSYSLYLVHYQVGGRVINLAARLPPSLLVMTGAVILASVVSLGVAYLMYRFVEKPSQQYAASLRFGSGSARTSLER